MHPIDSLTSNDLLGILYVLETTRKNVPTQCDTKDWSEFVESFRPRLKNLSEEGRKELLIAHLLSVEDLDLFDEKTLSDWLVCGAEPMKRVSSVLGTGIL